MQRVPALVVLLLSLLYLGLLDAGNRAASAQEPDKADAPGRLSSQTHAPQAPAPQPSAPEPSTPEPSTPGPHIALLLPLESSAFAKAGEAVRRGVYEAYRVQPVALPLVVYSTTDDFANTSKRFRAAVDAQARVVIGPIARSAVTAVVQGNAIVVPTLALNGADAVPASRNVYFFGMQTEAEARKMAGLAAAQGHRRALVLIGKNALNQRLAQTFIQEWRQLGNTVVREAQVGNETGDFARLRDQMPTIAADMAFLALDAQPAKLARAYLGPAIAMYATSLINTGNDAIARLDLDGICFADMPWLVSPDDPAVLAYGRPDPGEMSFDLQRFYALGIDAYRLTRALLKPEPELGTLDGVTGTIVLERGNRFVRRPTSAQFVNGELRVLPDESSAAAR